MRHILRARDYIQHMIDASKRIELYVNQKDYEQFFSETLVQDAVIRNIEILGEAAKPDGIVARCLDAVSVDTVEGHVRDTQQNLPRLFHNQPEDNMGSGDR